MTSRGDDPAGAARPEAAAHLAAEGPNAGQITFWNEQAGPRWVADQHLLDAMLEPFGVVVLDAAGLTGGERVLDVGCGCGATVIEAAARVGAGGSVTGIDVSAPMLARARARAGDVTGGARIDLIEADAELHHFAPASFEAVISRFGVMFFADPVDAFSTLREALVPGGRLAFVCWQAPDRNPWITVPMAAVAAHVPLEPPPPPGSPGPFAFADPALLDERLGAAGFRDVEITAHEGPVALGGRLSLDEATAFMLRLGPVAGALAALDADAAGRVTAAVRDALASHLGDPLGGVALPSASWVVRARAGGG